MSEKPNNPKNGADKDGSAPDVLRPEATVPVPSEFRPRYVDDATFQKIADKVFETHKDVLRRLAEYDRGESA